MLLYRHNLSKYLLNYIFYSFIIRHFSLFNELATEEEEISNITQITLFLISELNSAE